VFEWQYETSQQGETPLVPEEAPNV
jgi:hypothetical protein